MEKSEISQRRIPLYGLIGLALLLLAWWMNWSFPGNRTEFLFFPQWLGYSLFINSLTYLRKGRSLLSQNSKAFAGLFILSIPAWWLFELVNLRTQNWFYVGADKISPLFFYFFTSVSFSTVMPAVFSTAELVLTFDWIANLSIKFRVNTGKPAILKFFIAGCAMLALMLAWPKYFFPFVWLSVYFIIEPINAWLGNQSMYSYAKEGEWRPVVALFVGCLMCGFFWEMWNYYSMPKWIYNVPFVGFLHIFEMPLLGYGGYLPFSLELYAMYRLLSSWLPNGLFQKFALLGPEEN